MDRRKVLAILLFLLRIWARFREPHPELVSTESSCIMDHNQDGFRAASGRIVGTQLCVRNIVCGVTGETPAPSAYSLTFGTITGPIAEVEAFLQKHGNVLTLSNFQLKLSTGPLVELRLALLTQVGVGIGATSDVIICENLHFQVSSINYLPVPPIGTSPGECMNEVTFSNFASLAATRPLMAVRDCGNGHWQAKLGSFNVNVYPYAHPAKYVLQGPGITPAVASPDLPIIELCDTALQQLHTLALSNRPQEAAMQQAPGQQAQCQQAAAQPLTSEAVHEAVAGIMRKQDEFRNEIAARIAELTGVEAVQVRNEYATYVTVLGTVEQTEPADNAFLAGKLDGLLTAFKLVSDLGQQGVALIEQQINALTAVVYPPQTGPQESAPQAAEAACSI